MVAADSLIQCLDQPAVISTTTSAIGQLSQYFAHRDKIGNLGLNLHQVRTRQLIRCAARLCWIVSQPKKSFDFLDCESELAAASYEAQAFGRGVVVSTVSTW